MKMRDGEVKEVLQILASLKTRPFTGSTNAIQVNNTVFPDFIITVEADEVFVTLAQTSFGFIACKPDLGGNRASDGSMIKQQIAEPASICAANWPRPNGLSKPFGSGNPIC